MADFQKLKLKQFPQVQDRETSEAKYWKNYTITGEEKLFGAPVCIDFDPSPSSNQYIVTASTKVSLYDSSTDQVQRAYSRFNDDAFSAKFRRDGRLFVAGDKAGFLRVFDVTTKAILRQVKRHTAAVRTTGWTADALHMLSGSDDKSVKLWDLATGEVTWEQEQAHTDYIRTLAPSPTNPHVFVSGGYDHAVAVWDTRMEEAVSRFSVDQPVTASLFTHSGSMLLTAAGNEIKVWDMFASNRLMHVFSNHQKDVTGLAIDAHTSRLLSCGLDGHVKIYNFQTMQVVHGIKYGSPLLSLAVSGDKKKLVVGYVDGRLETRTRQVAPAEDESERDRSILEGVSSSAVAAGGSSGSSSLRQGKFYKNAGAAASVTEDALVETERTTRLKPYEVQLKKFNYQQALDSALKTRNP